MKHYINSKTVYGAVFFIFISSEMKLKTDQRCRTTAKNLTLEHFIIQIEYRVYVCFFFSVYKRFDHVENLYT